MTYFFRRLPLSRLLLVCGLVIVLGISATALAFSLGTGPTPPAKPLADAVHEALTAPPVEGVSARIQLTDHLLEGASLAGGSGGTAGQLSSSPLLSGASGRLWIAQDGRVRLELQAEQGDTQVLYDGHTVSVYDASSNTLYRYTIPSTRKARKKWRPAEHPRLGIPGPHDRSRSPNRPEDRRKRSPISRRTRTCPARRRPTSPAKPPTPCASSPKEGGSLIGGGRALLGRRPRRSPARGDLLLRAAPPPALELAATEISYGPVAARCSHSRRRRTPRSRKSPRPAPTATGPSAARASSPHRHDPRPRSRAVTVLESKTNGRRRQDPLRRCPKACRR